MSSFEWDAFISHASEDKETFVVPLVEELQKYALRIWFDAFTLKVGDSLRESIDKGLAKSEYGIVVLSRSFFAKNWPQKELNGLFARQAAGKNVILPIWHDISKEDILTLSPLLSDLIACKSSEGIPDVAKALVRVIRPEAFELLTSISDSQRIMERIREQLSSKNPQLDCRVSVGPSSCATLSPTQADERGLVGSVTSDGVRLEFFAKDREAYNLKPISGRLRLTEEGWSKIQEALRKGEAVKLSQDHIRGISSDFFTSFGFDPAMFTETKTLALSPNSPLLLQRFRFRVRFTHGTDSEEFPFIEFRVARAGTGEVDLTSCGSQIPLHLTITVYTDGSHPEFGWSLSYEATRSATSAVLSELLSCSGMDVLWNYLT